MPQALRYPRLSGPLLLALALLACCVVSFVAYEAPGRRTFEMAAGLVFISAAGYVAWHVRPAYMLCGALAASCFSGNWELLSLPGSIAPDRLLLLAGIGMIVVRSRAARDRPRFELRLPHFLLLLVSLYVITSAVWFDTITDREALFRLTDRFGLIPFLAFAVAPLAFRTRKDRRAMIGTLAALGAYLSLTALFETVGANSLVFPRFIADPSVGLHYGRARGPFLEAQTMGIALFVCAVACCVGFQYWNSRQAKVLLGATALLSIAGTVFTLQRAVWIGVALGVAAGLLSVPRLWRYILPAAVGGVVLVTILIAVVPGLDDKVSSRTGGRAERSVWDRRNLNDAAVRVVGAYPMFGVRWQRWQDRAEPYFRTSPDYPLSGSTRGRIQVVHNVYLSNAAELGLLGAGLWVIAVLSVFYSALARRGPPDHAAWRAGLVAAGVMWATVMLFTPLAKPFPTLLIFMWAGVVYGSGWSSRIAGDVATVSSSVAVARP